MQRRDFLKLPALVYSGFLLSKAEAAMANNDGLSMPSIVDRLLANNDASINIMDFGAHSNNDKGFEEFDNRAIIQKVIDKCAEMYALTGTRYTVYIPNGIFCMSIVQFAKDNNSRNIGAFCLLLRSNIIISGTGVLQVFPSQYGRGAFFRVLGNDKNELLKNVDIIDVTIDGNVKAQTQGVQASNILLECKKDISIKNIKSINANGNGIQIRGGVYENEMVENISISGCYINYCNKIGIQVAQFDNLIIKDNEVSNCSDNGIDIYGDLGAGVSSKTNGNNFQIHNNNITGCLNGIFPETVSNGYVFKNNINGMVLSGIHLNRIHGLPQNINVINNVITKSKYGVSVTGDMRSISIIENDIRDINDSFLSFGSGKGNVSNINVENNTFYTNKNTKSIVRFDGEVVSNINIGDNFVKNHENNSIKNNILISHAKKIQYSSVKIKNIKFISY
ncbi:right-handed parallel beta-helix repeat-containing protein [Brenneria goodwinii]|uniref:right-handed parallel beta-helix repeat-containing protein n=1 Tax=Brenneria goodwinii TaxID=1109412 RepID=UPI0036DFE831